MNSHIFKTF